MKENKFDLTYLEQLVVLVEASGVHELELEVGETRVRIVKPPLPQVVQAAPAAIAPPPAPAGAVEESAPKTEADPGSSGSETIEVNAPMVGTFYRAPSPNAPPYTRRGERVSVGDTLCIIEAMKLMNELEAEVAGTVVEICLENGAPVEYGQALFRIDPD